MMVRILLVDDEPEIRVLTCMMLEKKGYEIRPDLILLDYNDAWHVGLEGV